jgi:hypothetical protein
MILTVAMSIAWKGAVERLIGWRGARENAQRQLLRRTTVITGTLVAVLVIASSPEHAVTPAMARQAAGGTGQSVATPNDKSICPVLRRLDSVEPRPAGFPPSDLMPPPLAAIDLGT